MKAIIIMIVVFGAWIVYEIKRAPTIDDFD